MAITLSSKLTPDQRSITQIVLIPLRFFHFIPTFLDDIEKLNHEEVMPSVSNEFAHQFLACVVETLNEKIQVVEWVLSLPLLF
jgi:hypothetical protein